MDKFCLAVINLADKDEIDAKTLYLVIKED